MTQFFHTSSYYQLVTLIACLLMGLLLSVPSFAATSIGTVLATRGTAIAVGSTERALKRGSKIFVGEKLITRAASRLLVRLTDNSALALKSNTEYQVRSYNYNPNNRRANRNSNSFFKGSMRILTGAISKQNPKAYKVQTPVAVIGVRGTEYELRYTCPRGNIRGNSKCKMQILVRKGFITVRNNKGTVVMGSGKYMELSSPDDPLRVEDAPVDSICVGV